MEPKGGMVEQWNNVAMSITFETRIYKQEKADLLNLTFPEDFYERSQILKHFGRDFPSYNLYDSLGSFDFPTLIIYGDQEPATESVAIKIQNTIPGSQLEIITECGHFSYIEQPEKLKKLIERFIN